MTPKEKEIIEEVERFYININRMLKELEGHILDKEDCEDLAKTIKNIIQNALLSFQKALKSQKEDEIKFLINLKHNYNHEGESYKQIEERLKSLEDEK